MKFNFDKFAFRTAETIRQDDVDRLARIRIPNADAWAKHLADEVASGGARLSHVLHDGKVIGSVLWRVEHDVERELVVMSVAAESGFSLVSFLAQAVDALAVAEKCDTARFHTIRPALVQFVQTRGWHASEIVMRKNYVT